LSLPGGVRLVTWTTLAVIYRTVFLTHNNNVVVKSDAVPARGMLKQLLDKGAAGNATFHRAVGRWRLNQVYT
jgi:hypothetical protein